MAKIGYGTAAVLGGLGAGIGQFATNYFQARDATKRRRLQDRELRIREELGRGRLKLGEGQLANAVQNTGLRGSELEQDKVKETGRQTRHSDNLGFKYFDKFSGNRAQEAPSAYARALESQFAGDPGFATQYDEALRLATQHKLTEAGQTAGRRSAASAGAKSAQKRKDNERMFKTQEALRNKTELPPPAERFYPSQERTISPEEQNRRSSIKLRDDLVRRARKIVENEGTIDPRLFLSLGDQLESMGEQVDENKIADALLIPQYARAKLFQQARELDAAEQAQTRTSTTAQ